LIEVVAQVGPSLSYHITVTHRALDADPAELAQDYAELSAALLDEDDERAIAVTKRIFGIGVSASAA
jgi:hypothetical protein